MYGRNELPLPHWFERPIAASNDDNSPRQRNLFQSMLHKELAELGVSMDELQRWNDKGWVSFGPTPDAVVNFDDPRIIEVSFVRSVVRSCLTDAQIVSLFALMSCPKAFDSSRIAYSFEYGWVEPKYLSEPDLEEVIDAHFDSWLVQQDEEHLREIQERIMALLDTQLQSHEKNSE